MIKDEIEQVWQELWHSRKPNEGEHIRFELGGEEFDNIEQPIPRFLKAYNRVVAVADYIFEDDLIGVIAWHPQDTVPRTGVRKVKSGFEAMEKTGLSAKHISEWKADVFPDPDEEQGHSEMRSYDLRGGKSDRDCLIWHSVAFEMPIYPTAGVLTWLLDPKTAMMLHVYDDRGMDVIAKNSSDLKPIHDRFETWLLDYDRDRMSKLF